MNDKEPSFEHIKDAIMGLCACVLPKRVFGEGGVLDLGLGLGYSGNGEPFCDITMQNCDCGSYSAMASGGVLEFYF